MNAQDRAAELGGQKWTRALKLTSVSQGKSRIGFHHPQPDESLPFTRMVADGGSILGKKAPSDSQGTDP